jgi:PilZ domain
MAQRVDERRREPRAELALACTLRRRIGAPLSCRTVDVGAGGMSVLSGRPLAPDELLVFELEEAGGAPLTGRATVLRQQAHQVYALAFTQLPDAARATLADLIARR